MIRDPYKTTIGLHSSNFKKTLEEKLLKFLVTVDYNLSYEYNSLKDGKVYFITGRNENEREIPSFRLSVLTEDLDGNDILFVDVRQAVRVKEEFNTLEEITRDKGYMDFILIQAIFILQLQDRFNLNDIYDSSVKSLSSWITTSISNAMMIDGDDKVNLNIIVLDSIISFIDPDKDHEVKEHIISKLNVIGKVDSDHARKVLEKLNRDPKNIKDMIDNIQKSELGDRLKRLDYVAFNSIITSTMFGLGIKESIMMAIEHIPTWLGLLYIASEHRVYSKTQLGSMLKRQSRVLGKNDLIKYIDNTLKDNISASVSMEDNEVIGTGNHTLYKKEDNGITKYRLYLGDIADNDKELHGILNELMDAGEKDTMNLFINSNGGIVNQGMQFWNIIDNKFSGRTEALLNNTAKSMGSIIFCMCDKRVITETSELMFHNYSHGSIGKGGEVKDHVEHTSEHIGDFFKKIVMTKGFLSDAEYKEMQIGREFWLNAEKLCHRGIATHILVNGKEITAKEYLKTLGK